MAVEPLVFEITYRRESYKVVGGTLVRDVDTDKRLPDVPGGFAPFKGNHGPVSKRADDMNKAQTRLGFLHYFFFPQIAGAPVNTGPARA